ncbi:hypothetical protein Bca101_101555 [Brassica carinata]
MNENLVKECEQIMLSEFSEMHGQIKLLHEERTNLFGALRQLEEANLEAGASGIHSSLGRGKYSGTCSNALNAFSFSRYLIQLHRLPLCVLLDIIWFLECSTTASSDDKQEFEDVSEEDEPSFHDTKEYFNEPNIGSGSNLSNNSGSADIKRRTKLPDPAEKEKAVSLWSMIKDNVGKDLTRVCLPVYFNEPISSLQKCFEDLEYSYLLDRAYEHGKSGNGLLRALNVAAFAVSGYASTEGRHCKPFNPLLGETYEADFPEKGIRFFSEKVSHHPTVIASHCEGKGWKFWGDTKLRSKFWGRSIQVEPVGVLTLEFDDGEVTSTIYNIILGKLYCDHHGVMQIRGNRQHSCTLKFKEQSLLERNPHQVNGFVEDVAGKKAATVFGKWDDSLYYVTGDGVSKTKVSDPASNASLLWKRTKPPLNVTRYNLTSFAITLNELTPGLKEMLPPTDSRLRPDQRHLENGEYEKANLEKQRRGNFRKVGGDRDGSRNKERMKPSSTQAVTGKQEETGVGMIAQTSSASSGKSSYLILLKRIPSRRLFSISIKTLFYELGASPAIYELDKDPQGRDMEQALFGAFGSTQVVPAVFVGGRDLMDKVMRMSSERGVVIFTKSSCCLCYAVQILFRDLRVQPTIYEIDTDPDCREIEKALLRIGCSTAVPAVFVGGKLVGSTNEVMSLHLSGSLVPLIRPYQSLPY